MNHFQKKAVLSMLETMSFPQVVVTTSHLFFQDSQWSLKDIREEVRQLRRDSRLVQGAVVSRVQGHTFELNTGDRTKVLSEEFLTSCSAEWAIVLRAAISELKAEVQ